MSTENDDAAIHSGVMHSLEQFQALARSNDPARDERIAEWVNDPQLGINAILEGLERIRDAEGHPGSEVLWVGEAAVTWCEHYARLLYAEDTAGYDKSDMPFCRNLEAAVPDPMTELADRNFDVADSQIEEERCPGCRLCAGQLG